MRSVLDPCRVHTQAKFVNHDGIAEGLLNADYCSATGFLLPWRQHLTNTPAVLDDMIRRMEVDWVATQPKSRKPWNVKDLESCFGFHYCFI